MTKVIYNSKFPAIDRDEFLTPFDRMFDTIVSAQFPEIERQIGVKPFFLHFDPRFWYENEISVGSLIIEAHI